MCKEKPSAQPLEAIKWLSSWLLENNPNKGRAMAETDFALSRDELAGAEPAVMIEDVDEVVAAVRAGRKLVAFNSVRGVYTLDLVLEGEEDEPGTPDPEDEPEPNTPMPGMASVLAAGGRNG